MPAGPFWFGAVGNYQELLAYAYLTLGLCSNSIKLLHFV